MGISEYMEIDTYRRKCKTNEHCNGCSKLDIDIQPFCKLYGGHPTMHQRWLIDRLLQCIDGDHIPDATKMVKEKELK